jgi:NAD(P)-dependent dehydrogenase (short-subunit alcohol dehydrogenase family)
MTGEPTRLRGKTVLITGAARRIGRACALALAGEGVNVVVHYHQSAADAARLCGELRERGVGSWPIQADLADPAAAEACFTRARDQAGPLDLLLNNASVYGESRIGGCTLEELRRNLDLHAWTPLMLARCFAAQQREGMIINFLDARVTGSDRHHAAYQLSKQMLLCLTRMLALEFAPRVRVNAVAPGAILPPPGQDESVLRGAAEANPLRRIGSLADVTRAVLYLAGSEFVTGQVVFVDGGYHLKGALHV